MKESKMESKIKIKKTIKTNNFIEKDEQSFKNVMTYISNSIYSQLVDLKKIEQNKNVIYNINYFVESIFAKNNLNINTKELELDIKIAQEIAFEQIQYGVSDKKFKELIKSHPIYTIYKNNQSKTINEMNIIVTRILSKFLATISNVYGLNNFSLTDYDDLAKLFNSMYYEFYIDEIKKEYAIPYDNFTEEVINEMLVDYVE